MFTWILRIFSGDSSLRNTLISAISIVLSILYIMHIRRHGKLDHDNNSMLFS